MERLNQPPIIHAIARHASVPTRVLLASTCKRYRGLVFTDPNLWRSLVVLEPWQKDPGFMAFLGKIADFVESLWLPRVPDAFAEMIPVMSNVKHLTIFDISVSTTDRNYGSIERRLRQVSLKFPGVLVFSLERSLARIHLSLIMEMFPHLQSLYAWFDSGVVVDEKDLMRARKTGWDQRLRTCLIASPPISDVYPQLLWDLCLGPYASTNTTHLAVDLSRSDIFCPSFSFLTGIAELRSLKCLIVNYFDEQSLSMILDAIALKLSNLKTLVLLNAELNTGALYNYINTTVARLETLVVDFSFSSTFYLPSEIFSALGMKMSTLRNLILSRVNFSHAGENAPVHLAQLRQLEYLSLSGARLQPLAGSFTTVALAGGFKRLKYLIVCDATFGTDTTAMRSQLNVPGCLVISNEELVNQSSMVLESTRQALRLHPASKFNRVTAPLLRDT